MSGTPPRMYRRGRETPGYPRVVGRTLLDVLSGRETLPNVRDALPNVRDWSGDPLECLERPPGCPKVVEGPYGFYKSGR